MPPAVPCARRSDRPSRPARPIHDVSSARELAHDLHVLLRHRLLREADGFEGFARERQVTEGTRRGQVILHARAALSRPVTHVRSPESATALPRRCLRTRFIQAITPVVADREQLPDRPMRPESLVEVPRPVHDLLAPMGGRASGNLLRVVVAVFVEPLGDRRRHLAGSPFIAGTHRRTISMFSGIARSIPQAPQQILPPSANPVMVAIAALHGTRARDGLHLIVGQCRGGIESRRWRAVERLDDLHVLLRHRPRSIPSSGAPAMHRQRARGKNAGKSAPLSGGSRRAQAV